MFCLGLIIGALSTLFAAGASKGAVALGMISPKIDRATAILAHDDANDDASCSQVGAHAAILRSCAPPSCMKCCLHEALGRLEVKRPQPASAGLEGGSQAV